MIRPKLHGFDHISERGVSNNGNTESFLFRPVLLGGFIPQLILNSTSLPGLGGLSPMECFLGTKPIKPLGYFLDPEQGGFKEIDITDPKKLKAYFEEIHTLLREREAIVAQLQEEAHAAVQAKQEQTRGVRPLDVAVGDYVMVRNTDKAKAKFARNWRGPAQVVAMASEGHLVSVRFLGTDRGFKPLELHIRNVVKWDFAEQLKTPELAQHAELSTQRLWEFERFLGLRKTGKVLEIQVKWADEGYEPTWEKLATMVHDVPDAVCDYLLSGVTGNERALLPEVCKRADVKRLFKRRGLLSKTGSVTMPTS